MLPRNHPDGIQIAFDDRRWWPMLGCCKGRQSGDPGPALCGLRELVDGSGASTSGRRAGTGERAGDKMLTLVASALGWRRLHRRRRCVRVRPGDGAAGAAWSRRHPPWAPSCAASAGGRSVNSTGRQLLARAWVSRGRDPATPLTIDLDSTICETYLTGQGGSAPPRLHRRCEGITRCLAIAAGTGEVLMSRGASARGPSQHRPRRRPLPP